MGRNVINEYKQENQCVDCLNFDEFDLILEDLDSIDDKIKQETDKRIRKIPDQSTKVAEKEDEIDNLKDKLEGKNDNYNAVKITHDKKLKSNRQVRDKIDEICTKERSLKDEIALENENIKILSERQDKLKNDSNKSKNKDLASVESFKDQINQCEKE